MDANSNDENKDEKKIDVKDENKDEKKIDVKDENKDEKKIDVKDENKDEKKIDVKDENKDEKKIDYHKIINETIIDISKLYSEIKEFYVKNLHLKDSDIIDITFATALSKALPGEPCWLGLIAPPSSGKTEILRSFGEEPTYCVYPTSKLTENSLASGSGDVKSMLASELDGKLWIIKDGTTLIRSKRADVVLSNMREMFDGYFAVDSGMDKGTKRGKTRTTLIFGVTPFIDRTKLFMASLGERFIYFRIPSSDESEEDDNIYYSMVKNSFLNSTKKRDFIEKKVKKFMDLEERLFKYFQNIEIDNNKLMDDDTGKLIYQLSKLVAQMRVDIEWDYKEQNINDVGEREGPGRLSLQLLKLGLCLRLIRGKAIFSDEEKTTVIKVGLDCVPRKRLIPLIRFIRQYIEHNSNLSIDNSDMLSYMKNEYNISNKLAERLLEELEMLKVLNFYYQDNNPNSKKYWNMNPNFYIKNKHMFDYLKDVPLYSVPNIINIPGSEHNPKGNHTKDDEPKEETKTDIGNQKSIKKQLEDIVSVSKEPDPILE